MIDASVRKSQRAFSDEPGFSVLMATSMSCTKFGGIFKRPRHTSPNSPPPENNQPRDGCCSRCKLADAFRARTFVHAATHTDYCFNGDVAGVDFARKFANGLVRVFIGVRVNVRTARAKQRGRHWKITTLTIITVIALVGFVLGFAMVA